MPKKKKEVECRSWVVKATCTIEKEIVCEDCTEEQARSDPFEFAVDEQEIGQDDYKVTDVKPNK